VKPQIVLGQCINQRRDGLTGFDAFAANAEQGMFALCDGANSCPDSGKAAQWLCQQLVEQGPCATGAVEFETCVYQLHHEILHRFPDTASTALSVQVGVTGMTLHSVGDSSLRVYKRSWAGWGRWQEISAMPRDIDERGHPRQLIGSEVLDTVHHRLLRAQGPLLALMMSDGPADTLTDRMIKDVLQSIQRQSPSSHDLDYLCQELVHDALNMGCPDDASVAMVWAHWS
jgi:serine/threonine protein phosphatase PrpC